MGLTADRPRTRRSRRGLLGCVVLVVSVGMLAASGTSSRVGALAAGLPEVTILEGGHVIGWAPTYVAVERGFFRGEGLDVNYVISPQGATTAVAAVISGSAFMAFTGSPVPINAVMHGSQVRIVLVAGAEYTVELTASNKLLQEKHVTPESPLEQKVRALEGVRIGIYTPGDSTDQFVHFLLKKYGIDPDTKVQLVSTETAANMLAAFKQGSIDVLAVSPPTGEQAEQLGLGKVIVRAGEIPEIKAYPYLVGSASVKEIRERPGLVKGTVKAMARAIQYLRTNPEGAKPLVRKHFQNFDPAVFEIAYQAMLRGLPENPIPTRKGFAAITEFQRLQGKPFTVQYEQAIDPTLSEEAVKELKDR